MFFQCLIASDWHIRIVNCLLKFWTTASLLVCWKIETVKQKRKMPDRDAMVCSFMHMYHEMKSCYRYIKLYVKKQNMIYAD